MPKITAADLPEKMLDVRLVFVNGVYSPDLSDDVDGLNFTNLGNYLQQDDVSFRENLLDLGQLGDMPLKAENTAHINDGAVMIVEDNTTIYKPVEILYFTTDKGLDVKPKTFTRNLFVLKDDAKLTVVEHFAGSGDYSANHVTEISLYKGASLYQYRYQNDSKSAWHFAHTRLMQQDNSAFESLTYTAGARFSRHDVQSLLIGQHVSCNINGLYMLSGDQHYDTKILADHMEPDGTSQQLFKGILDDQTRAVFQGKVHVRRPAQRTDGRQLSHALLLSEQAEIDAKPELEIYADDVECAHGALSGALDEAPLFYMQSRGIPKDQARRLLLKSFLAEPLEQISNAHVQEIFMNKLEEALK